MKVNGTMIVCIKIVGVACDTHFNHAHPFNECMEKIIEDKKALAASDAAVKIEKWEVIGQCLTKKTKQM